MKRKEIKDRVTALITAGTPKTEILEILTKEGIKESEIAFQIASYADPVLCDIHDRKINTAITLMFIQAAFGLLIGFSIGSQIGPIARWVVSGLCAFFPLLFAWGFYKHKANFYNAYIVLTIIQLPRQLEGYSSSPIATSIGLAIGISILAYIWYVRTNIFPDFSFIGPKKSKGQYIFSS